MRLLGFVWSCQWGRPNLRFPGPHRCQCYMYFHHFLRPPQKFSKNSYAHKAKSMRHTCMYYQIALWSPSLSAYASAITEEFPSERPAWFNTCQWKYRISGKGAFDVLLSRTAINAAWLMHSFPKVQGGILNRREWWPPLREFQSLVMRDGPIPALGTVSDSPTGWCLRAASLWQSDFWSFSVTASFRKQYRNMRRIMTGNSRY